MPKEDNAIWYPFTQMKTAEAPIHIDSAENCTLYAKDGNTYIDAVSSWWVNIHGHSNPIIAKAIADQAKKLEHVIFAGFTHTPAIDLSKNLLSVLPDHFKKIFFSDNGSTAVEVALKMALQYWHNQGVKNKINIIAFEGAYHGDTFGAMSIAERNEFNAAFSKHLFKVSHIPVPTKENIKEVTEKFTALIDKENVAAFIFEPLIQGTAGMKMYSAKHLDTLLSIAKKKNILCIADEVMTGFGRTGKNFAIEYVKSKPDIICLSKGITGGFMPLGVTACSNKIYDAFYANDKTKTFYHGHSYTGNPLSCAAANASIELLKSKKCKDQITMITEQHKKFAESISSHDFVKELRQQGTILAIELNTKQNTSYFNSIRDLAYKFYLSNGVLLRPLGNIVYIMPPYCITKKELSKIYTTIEQSLTYLNDRTLI
ncbi:adenosylmethionine--8-amino-7-oxononanoate transaminase [Ferruginibacter lapsinanis]|uniref:adenosylmethionine--8-amino-7-oxononanoate transaminase n=1 Tax=Ferruginibacter lapsinanis TaxID=563172 RepID=UPI001E41C39F|nr:adenosylmethionine--8-amino-7-oxononanoate transaminase [Ferruginibacter lapsinanis]UEG49247.1 adenosylmethionine--8-amino-7-oxononanoate transaminase [Ferruginibacter lapsinanis]